MVARVGRELRELRGRDECSWARWRPWRMRKRWGVKLAWEDVNRVAMDSQGVLRRIWHLQFEDPRSWIEEALKKQMQERREC